MYIEDLTVDTALATGSSIADHVCPDSRTARQFVESSTHLISSYASSSSMEIAHHARHHCQETLLDVEAGDVVSEGLMTIPVRLRSTAARMMHKPKNAASSAPHAKSNQAMAQKAVPVTVACPDVTEMAISSLIEQTVGTRVPSDASLMEAGIDSLAASEVVASIGAELDVELSATLLFDHPSITAIC